MKYYIRDAIAGNAIDWFDDIEAAKKELKQYEIQDKKDKKYTENFYEILESTEEEIKKKFPS